MLLSPNCLLISNHDLSVVVVATTAFACFSGPDAPLRRAWGCLCDTLLLSLLVDDMATMIKL